VLQELLATDVYLMTLVFARIGSAVMVLPGFGELTVPPRVRLGFALALSFVLFPLIAPALPAAPPALYAFLVLLIGEMLIGIAIGLIARIVVSSLQVAGTIIGFNNGLASAMLFDPNAGQQGAITGAFLSALGVTMLFTTNMHHLMIMALVDSYALFVPGAALPIGDFSEMASHLVGESFLIGFQIALPIMIVGTVIYVAMGLMSRLMPQLQVFFIALPVQIVVGFSILAIMLGAGMMMFIDSFETAIGGFLVQP
jgi:flagellar biosynthesis protein FliR